MGDRCCKTCEYCIYDSEQGYICDNILSEYVSDFVEADHYCDEYELKEDD